MKILHLLEFYLDNWTYQENILPQKQAELGNEVILIVSYKYPEYCQEQFYNGDQVYYNKMVKIIRENYASNKFNLKISNLVKHLHNEKPDMIFIHGIKMLNNNELWRYIKKNKPKVVIDIHQDNNNSLSGKGLKNKIKHIISKYYYRILLANYDKYISKFFYIAPSCKKFCEKFYSIKSSKLFPLYLGSDYDLIDFKNRNFLRESLRKEQKMSNDSTVIIFAGKIDKNKRIELLIEAFNELNIPNTYLILAGSVSEEYKKYIERCISFNPNIRFLGWKSSKELMNLFLACDLGVYPGSQSVLWQNSLCCGLPCVYGYWEGIEYLNNGNAKILKERTVKETREVIYHLILNKDNLYQMHRCALLHGNENFNYMQIAKESLK